MIKIPRMWMRDVAAAECKSLANDDAPYSMLKGKDEEKDNI